MGCVFTHPLVESWQLPRQRLCVLLDLQTAKAPSRGAPVKEVLIEDSLNRI